MFQKALISKGGFKMLKKQTLFLLLVGSVVLSVPAQAEITIDPNFTGTLIITSSEGSVEMVSSGEKMPAISSGSSIEVIEGQVQVSADEPDEVNLMCLSNKVAVKGDQVSLSCSVQTGLVKVLAGPADWTDPDGKVTQLQTGDEQQLTPTSPLSAPPTEAGEETGLPADTGTPPAPDSRDIEASPAQ